MNKIVIKLVKKKPSINIKEFNKKAVIIFENIVKPQINKK